MVFDAIWLAVLLQSERSDSVVLLLGVPRVSSHIAEAWCGQPTRVCWCVYVVFTFTQAVGVCMCVCWGGCLGFHSLAAPYPVRKTSEMERAREMRVGGTDGEERGGGETERGGERMHWQFHASSSWKAPNR